MESTTVTTRRRLWTDVATVADLAAYLYGRDGSDIDETQVAIRLHRVTLPKLEDAGIVDYDSETNTARYRWNAMEPTGGNLRRDGELE